MKKRRFLTIIAACFIAVTVSAQTSHLKFMGIPLNGTITNFHAKLVQKGFRPDVAFNRIGGQGHRLFGGGTFSGEDANIHVYYNPKTKIVYRANAVLDRSSEDGIESLYNQFKRSVGNKYADCSLSEEGEQNGYESIGYYIFNSDRTLLGVIGLYISKYEDSYEDTWSLHIDYEDYANSEKNEDLNSDDL